MVPGAVNSEIVVELPGGQQIVSVITKESAEPAPPSKGGKSDPRIKEFSERFKKHTPQLQDVTDRRSTAHFTEAGMPPDFTSPKRSVFESGHDHVMRVCHRGAEAAALRPTSRQWGNGNGIF